MEHLLTLAIAAAISLAIQPIMVALAPRLGLIDRPDPRKIHTHPVPRVGGWGVFIGATVALLIWQPFDSLVAAYLFGAVVLAAVGTWDDHAEIGHYPKFLGQLVATAPLVFGAGLYISHVPFLSDPLPAYIGKPFTLFALVGMINATNHSDGLDGLAGGEALLSLVAMAVLGWMAGGTLVPVLALAATGAVAGFLRHNNHPASLFLGDAGSQFIGFTLGVLAVVITQRTDPHLSPAVALLLLGLPIADILVVFAKRASGGMNWFRATRNHIHHRLLDLGLGQRGAVTVIYSVHATLVIAGVFLRDAPNGQILAVYIGVCGMLFFLLHVAERRQLRAASVTLASLIDSAVKQRWLVDAPRRLLPFALAIYLLVLALWAPAVSPDYALAGLPLAALLLVEGALSGGTRSLVSRALLYLAATYVVYAAAYGKPPAIDVWQPELVLGLAALLTVAILFSPRRRRFEFHPTGFDLLALVSVGAGLILFAALPERIVPPSLPLQLIVFYYGIELLSVEQRDRRNPLKPLMLGVVMLVVLRGLA